MAANLGAMMGMGSTPPPPVVDSAQYAAASAPGAGGPFFESACETRQFFGCIPGAHEPQGVSRLISQNDLQDLCVLFFIEIDLNCFEFVAFPYGAFQAPPPPPRLRLRTLRRTLLPRCGVGWSSGCICMVLFTS